MFLPNGKQHFASRVDWEDYLRPYKFKKIGLRLTTFAENGSKNHIKCAYNVCCVFLLDVIYLIT